MKILIIEDETSLSNSIASYLKADNYLCEIAGNYKMALDKIESFDYDCILLDITLPDGNGLNVLNDYKYYWILVPIFFTAFEKKDVKNAFYVLVFSFCLYALLSLSIFIGLFEIKDSNSSNPKGILAYALVTVYMALNTLLAFYFYIKEENRKIKYIILLISILSFSS